MCPIILPYKSCLHYHFHCYFSSPIELNKTIPSFCTHKFDTYVIFYVLYIYSNSMLLSFTFNPNHNNQLQRLLQLCGQFLYPKEAYWYERRGWCHHSVIPRPARTGPGAVQGTTRWGIERCNGCTWGGWVPPRYRRAPAPHEAILNVEYRCWSCPSWRNGWEAFLIISFLFSKRENRKTGGGGGGRDDQSKAR